jgi:retinol-binding protein 3
MRLSLTLLLLLGAGVNFAAARQIAIPQTPQISNEFVAKTVASLQSLIKERYFDTAVIPNVNSMLDAAVKRGDFAGAKDMEQLAKLLTTTLYQASHDKHLFVLATAKTGAGAEGPLTRAEAGRLSNFGIKEAEVLEGNVGYLKITSFDRRNEGAGDVLDDAMRFLSRTDALILDLRGNMGGSPDTAVQLLSYFFEPPDLLLFQVIPRSGDAVEYRTVVTGAGADATRPLYVLVSAETWSAGEGVPFLLQERHRATIVGERTVGAANPASPWPVNEELKITIPFGRVKSAVEGKNWEGTGVVPDLATSSQDAFKTAYVRALETLAERAKNATVQQMLGTTLAKAKKSDFSNK